MRPEESRINAYRKLKINRLERQINEITTVKFNEWYQVDLEIVRDLEKIIRDFIWTMTDEDVREIIKEIEIVFIDERDIFVIIDVFDKHIPLVNGRGGNNMFSMKRVMNNYAGKISKRYNNKFRITMDLKRFLKEGKWI